MRFKPPKLVDGNGKITSSQLAVMDKPKFYAWCIRTRVAWAYRIRRDEFQLRRLDQDTWNKLFNTNQINPETGESR